MKSEFDQTIAKYHPDVWKKLIFQKQKENLLNNTVNAMQEEAKVSSIKTVFRGHAIALHPINDRFENAKLIVDNRMGNGLCGQFDFAINKIRINPMILGDGKLACESASHEATHKTQNEISQLCHLYDQGSLEWEYATIAKMSNSFENNFNSFGISVKGRLYVPDDNLGAPVLNRLSSSLYALCAMERHACLTSISIAKDIPEADLSMVRLDHLSYSEAHLASAILNFKDSYYCNYLSVQQIYQSIDNAQSFIAFGRGPINDLEANIAYDMMAILEYENSEFARSEALLKLYERMNHDNKRKALEILGHIIIDQPHELIDGHVVTNDCPISHLRSVVQLIEMSRSEQISNPIMIANFAFEKDVDIFPYLHCPEAFEEWLFSEPSLRQLTKEAQEGLGEILGSKYSLENRQAVIAQRKEQQSEQTLTEDVGYVFQRGD